MPVSRAILIAALTSLALALIGHALVRAAHAHSWYPIDCCSGMDCAPVDRVDVPPIAGVVGALVSSGLMVTTIHGIVLVPPNFPRRESKDSRSHACIRRDQNGDLWLICYFIPPSS